MRVNYGDASKVSVNKQDGIRFREKWGDQGEERGLRAQGKKNCQVLAAAAEELCRSARIPASDRSKQAEQFAKYDAAREPHPCNGSHCGRRVPTLPSLAAWRAGRRWPRLRETAESGHS